MSLMSLYEKVESPIRNIGLIKELIDIYLQTNNFDEYYKRAMYYLELKPCQSDDQKMADYNKEKFIEYMFNLWKKNVLACTPDDFSKLLKYDCDKDENDLQKLKDYVKNVESISLESDNSTDIDKEMSDIINKYNWFKTESGWIKINSSYVDIRNINQEVPQHIISLTVKKSSMTYKIVHYFILLCNEYNLTYDLKYNYDNVRYDTLIIYSSTNNLEKYISIIEALKERFKDIDLSLDKPSNLMGTLYNNIGYSSKTCVKDQQFVSQRLSYLYTAIDKVINNWYNDEIKNRQLLECDCTYFEYFIDSIESRLQGDLNLSGYNAVTDFAMYQLIKKKLKKFETIKLDEINDISITLLGKKVVGLSKREIFNILQIVFSKVLKYEPDFTNQIMRELEILCKQYGIDFNTFCCDQQTINNMINFDFSNNSSGVIITPNVPTWCSNPLLLPYFIGPDLKLYSSYQDYLNNSSKQKKYVKE